MAQAVLIVAGAGEDGEAVRAAVAGLGHPVLRAADLDEARQRLGGGGRTAAELALVGIGAAADLATVQALRRALPELPVIAFSGRGEDELADRAIEAGAADYVVLPARRVRLRLAIANALRLNALSGQVSRLRRRHDGAMVFQDLVGESPAMRRVGDLAARAAASNISVLIEGESGVGKEMVARAIQGSSARAGRPFVAVNCGAIPENLVESILFGHERGAFTGADRRHVGKFQEADGGTLFLDEIGELKPDIQVKLLRALQEGEIDPIGAKRPVKVDIRLISATNRNLAELVAAGSFREDLYYRLNVFPVVVPPLRRRAEDIEPLVRHFVSAFAASERKDVTGVDQAALRLLAAFPWPGNVRQLENTIYRAVVLADGELLTVADFPQLPQAAADGGEAESAAEPPRPAAAAALPVGAVAVLADGEVRPLERIEADAIRLALAHCGGQMSEAARRLGIGRSTLYRKLREHGLDAGGA